MFGSPEEAIFEQCRARPSRKNMRAFRFLPEAPDRA